MKKKRLAWRRRTGPQRELGTQRPSIARSGLVGPPHGNGLCRIGRPVLMEVEMTSFLSQGSCSASKPRRKRRDSAPPHVHPHQRAAR